ncbi:MAG: GGDEF domain-containing protein [Thermodesulfobacteriota bacterium]
MRLPSQVKEFLAASTSPYSYNILENIYIWFGILWGLPIPVVTGLMEIHFLKTSGIPHPLSSAMHSPLQWFFMVHPLIFAVIFGILGTIRHQKDQALSRTIEQLEKLSIHDPLTGLKNRRYFVHIFHDECARSLRRKEPLSLLFLDIDFFKKINDTHGHYYGDIILKEISACIMKRIRPYDTAVRWGGEEFLILLRATDEAVALVFAERIRKNIEKGCSPAITIPITVSIGLAQYCLNDELENLTDRADQALYQAKHTGRNKVVAWSALQ